MAGRPSEKAVLLPPAAVGQTRRTSRCSFRRRAAITATSALALLWLGRSAVPHKLSAAMTLAGHVPTITNKELQTILLDTPSSERAAEWLYYYTSGPHLAGQNYSQAAWTRDRWAEWGAPSDIAAYDLYLNTPLDHSLSLLEAKKADAEGKSWEVTFRATLEEDVIDEDPTTSLANRVPTFHGYSASGNVTGPLVYVNYGTFQDYADLQKANVSLEGAIAIARYGGIFRGLKVKRAQELGAVGVILYSDPGDDNGVTEEAGYAAYPDGPARQPSSVQRGSVQFLSVAPGDPTTPGWPSLPGVPRVSPNATTPSIPSLPISYAEAVPLLKALNGHGPSVKDLGPYWDQRLGLASHGVAYNIGPTSADEAVVQLYNEQEYTTTPIWDVIGVINGSALPDEVVVVGNHRDAWIAGGAVDPNSGSAVLNEVVRSFGQAVAQGWQPLRTIVFASWDGEEYGLLGSTEWVEQYLPWLSVSSLAYVNMDTGVSGPTLHASAAPLLHGLLRTVAAEVPSPNQTVPGETVADTWSGKIGPLGSGSDYTAFQDFAGIPSLDVGFGDALPVYHYHSNYDSYHWMAKFGDPGFVYHRTAAQTLGLLVGHLATEPVVPFSAADYAAALHQYVGKIRDQLARQSDAEAHTAFWAALSADEQVVARGATHDDAVSVTVQARQQFSEALDNLDAAVARLADAAEELDDKADALRAALAEHCHKTTALPSWLGDLLGRLRRAWLWIQISSVNHKYQYLERHFLYPKGLDKRSWFKHVVFAPGRWTGYAGAVFPGLVESIEDGNWTNAVRWSEIIENSVDLAAKSL